ncbi:Myb-like protein U [Bienertia sinuspersici]
MARCFPFPPPGYAGKCSSHEALILSIKLQKEKEKALSAHEGEKAVFDREKEKPKSSDKKKDKEHRHGRKRDREDRKKDKKDKEERKKEKKEKRAAKKAKLSALVDSGKQNVADNKFLKADNLVPEFKGKLQGSSCELLERSSVTEEHGLPIESQNMPCSSDSTGNSGKRRKSSSSPSGIQSNGGNVIRIRLSSSHKKDEPSTSGSKLQEVGPRQQMRENLVNSQVHPRAPHVKPESYLKQKDVIQDVQGLSCIASTSNASLDCVASTTNASLDCVPSTSSATLQPVSTDLSRLKGKTIEAVPKNEILPCHEKVEIKEKPQKKLSSHDRRMQKKDAVYQNLFVDWGLTPSLERNRSVVDENDDDEDWLFSKKDEDKAAKRSSASDDIRSCADNMNTPCAVSAVMQPRACLLADSEIYALPFTVPF